MPLPLQDWLTSIEIKFYESKVNLNWKNILKSIKEVRLRVAAQRRSLLLAHWHGVVLSRVASRVRDNSQSQMSNPNPPAVCAGP